MTSQGTAHGRFQRAIQRRHLLAAEMAAREMGGMNLAEALDLMCLVAEIDPARLDAYGRRWLARLADEHMLALGELELAVTALRVLPSPRAVTALRALL
jgi:hypothetical protein